MTALLSVVILIACQEGINYALGFDLGSLHTLNVFGFLFHITALISLLCDVPASKTNSAGCSVCTTSTRTGSFHQQKYGLYEMDQRKYPRNATFIMFFKFDMKICIDIGNVFKWIRFSSR